MNQMTPIDPYTWWRAAIAGHPGPIHADHPECGYFKLRDGKDGPWKPVAIWYDAAGNMICRVGNQVRDAQSVWTYAAKNPIAKDAAKVAFETGRFPDEVPSIGDNAPPDETLFDTVARVAAQAVDWLKQHGIKDARSKDMCANYRAQLLDLRKRADAEREAEKRPHLEASRAVDAKFKPVIECADTAAGELRDALTVYMRAEEAKLRAQAEAAQKAEADARAKLMRDDPIAAMTSPEPEPPAPVKVQAGGQRGRKTGLKTIKRTVVTDYAAALAFFAESDDVRDLVTRLAQRAMQAGVKVPGAEIVEERVAA